MTLGADARSIRELSVDVEGHIHVSGKGSGHSDRLSEKGRLRVVENVHAGEVKVDLASSRD